MNPSLVKSPDPAASFVGNTEVSEVGDGMGWWCCELDHESETSRAGRLEATVPVVQQISREEEKGMEGWREWRADPGAKSPAALPEDLGLAHSTHPTKQLVINCLKLQL